MGSTINNIYKCRRISYWICEECAAGMESIEAWSQQMLKIKYTRHVAVRTVGLFFWWWTLEFSGAKGQLFRVNSSRVTFSHQWLKFLSPRGESDFKFSGDSTACSCCLQPDRIESDPLRPIEQLKCWTDRCWMAGWNQTLAGGWTHCSSSICSFKQSHETECVRPVSVASPN